MRVDIVTAFPGMFDGFVRESDMHEVAVGLGVNGYGFDTEFLAGAQDAQCDFSPVRYNDFIKQRHGASSLEPWIQTMVTSG